MKIQFTAITPENSCYVFMFGEENYDNFLKYNKLDVAFAPSWYEVCDVIKDEVIDYMIPTIKRDRAVSLSLGIENYVWLQLTTKYPLVNFIGARLIAILN